MTADARRKPIRVCYYSTWAGPTRDAAEYLDALPERDLSGQVSDPSNPDLTQMARLDCDWDGENLRSFTSMSHPGLEFLPARVVGMTGLLEFSRETIPADEERWLLLIDQTVQPLESVIDRLLRFFVLRGGRVFLWSYDEASRRMPCFAKVAPHLSVLIHDELPLEDSAAAVLEPACLVRHQSWVANVVPFVFPFREDVDQSIVFVGSRLGLTPHRKRQLDFLKERFMDRITAISDHSLPVTERQKIARHKVHLCPEGRMFTSAGMRWTHTDRPFWAGCLGQVPVSEDSRWGGRLEELARARLVYRYPHGDLKALVQQCEEALHAPTDERRRIYDHFNRNQTVGTVAARLIAEVGAPS